MYLFSKETPQTTSCGTNRFRLEKKVQTIISENLKYITVTAFYS